MKRANLRGILFCYSFKLACKCYITLASGPNQIVSYACKYEAWSYNCEFKLY